MGRPPLFQRSPRLHPDLPGGEAEFPAPGAAPSPPGISLFSMALSVLPGLLGAVIMYAFVRPGGAHSPAYMLYSLPVMLLGFAAQIGNYLMQKNRYRRAAQEREAGYKAVLDEHRKQLDQARDLQRRILLAAGPAPGECADRAERLDARLWERSPQDADFLALRLGLGTQPFGIKVKAPRQETALNPDPLLRVAQGLAAQFAQVEGVPIALPLREVGAAGVAGPRTAVVQAVRALALQIAAHHSPDEVNLVALFPAEEAGDWAWLRWLPHVHRDDGTRLLAADRAGAHRLLADLYDLFNRRKVQAAFQRDAQWAPAPLPWYVFILADARLTEHEAVIPLLLREGQGLGAVSLVLAERREDLPKECRGIAEVVGGGAGTLTLTAPRLTQQPFAPDEATVTVSERLSRALAPVELNRIASAAEIPGKVTLLDLLGAGRVEDLDVLARWGSSTPDRTLAVPIGMRAGGEQLLLDLHDKFHGPHGLVAGATGAGKSELLQTFIAALAVSYHPHDVTFLMVDFKGGGMANFFRGLPHLVGTMTNLAEGNLARRALDALKAELKRRQRALGDAGVNHISDYLRLRREGAPLEPLPHLIIVADEFAELKQAQPEFMREFVSTVRVGRSLGVHLVLATQKPAGVVDEQIWSNTRFRLCLRVERPEDSRDVLKCADAAGITGAGRAFFQVGNNEVFELFQAGWGGAPYDPERQAAGPVVSVAEVGLSGERYPLNPAPVPGQQGGGAVVTQLEAVLEHVRQAAETSEIRPLNGPWLPPLPARLPLAELGADDGGRWLEPMVGLLDDPEHQRQEPLRLPLGREGHLAVYGAPGTGKTTFLQTLVLSAALAHSPADLHVYLVDGSGRSMAPLAGLPHAGGVMAADEAERITRLMRLLAQEMADRKERFARTGVGTLAAYRQSGVSEGPVPGILVGVDNYPAFAAAYPDCDETLAQIAREGGGLGIHLALSAHTPAAVRSRLSSNITLAAALTLADRGEYGTAVGRTGGLEPLPAPGRGLVKGSPPLEFQTALPAPGETEWERAVALKAIVQELNQGWTGARPRPVQVLPEVVPLCELLTPDGAPGPAPVGLEVESLAAFCPDLAEGPHFLISGPVESGKTTFLQTWLLALAATRAPEHLRLWLADTGGSGGLAPLQRLPHVQGYITDGNALAEALASIGEMLQERRQTGTGAAGEPRLVLAIHDFDGFREGVPPGTRERLEQMVRRDRGLGLHLMVCGASAVFNQSMDGFCRALRELQTGVVLGSSDMNDLSVFNLRLPPGESGRLLPPGLGYFVRRGRYRKIKAATPHAGDLTLGAWVERLAARREGTVCTE